MSRPNDREDFISLETSGCQPPEDYRRQVDALIQTSLTPVQRKVWTASAVAVGMVAVASGTLAAARPATFSCKLGLGLLAVFALVWCAHAVAILRAGRLDRHKSRERQAWMVSGMFFAAFVVGVWQGGILRDMETLLLGLLLVVAGFAVLLGWRVELNALKTREEIIQLQLQMAELMERMETSDGSPIER